MLASQSSRAESEATAKPDRGVDRTKHQGGQTLLGLRLAAIVIAALTLMAACADPEAEADEHFDLGVAHQEAEELEEAISEFSAVIRLEPDRHEAYYNRGIVNANAGNFRTAIDDFDAAIALKPDFADAFHNRALTWGNLDQGWRAVADFESATTLDPSLAKAHVAKGATLINLSQLSQAIESLDRALLLEPDNPGAYAIRAVAHAIVSNDAMSDADIARAIELGYNATSLQADVDRIRQARGN
ncbi:MAG: tetratricopeptide repeat protein [SAR202 cluster bacterium]|nr:tetratricopeptide repeat protein [SAR202 cluster bacterium]MQG67646.1 tetratricopeptide repeat protein [SAR202 cluster bacterium]HAL47030.1 hypothetical protein [Dehalococcoidia bacterium]